MADDGAGPDISIHSLTPERWSDLEHVLGRGGIGGCWCAYWIYPTTTAWREAAKGGGAAPNREVFKDVVERGPPPGLLAYDGAEAVAWARVMARARLPGLEGSRHYKTDLDVGDVWSLPCFVVRRSHRGRGLTGKLITTAISLAADQGARYLEAYPWDAGERKQPATIYLGVASTFHRLGFEVVQRNAPHKPMMRLALPGAD